MAPALRDLEVIIVDGKAIKRVAKRLKPLRGRKGGGLGGKAVVALELCSVFAYTRRSYLIEGGKAVVALELCSGVVVAMATPADGETNDAKLVPALVPQVREPVRGKRLWGADRQFCALPQPAVFRQDGAHCLVRYQPQTPFSAEAAPPVQRGQDAQGRVWEPDWGW